MDGASGKGPRSQSGPETAPDSSTAAGVPKDGQDSRRSTRGARRSRPLCRFSEERGVALPVALAVLMLVGSLATVAAKAATTAQHQTLRDTYVKRALQAATAGIQAATYQVNLLQPTALQCVIRDTTGTLSLTTVGADGWCAPQTEVLEDGATYTARVSGGVTVHSNGQVLSQRRVISTGNVNGFKRRVLVTTSASTGEPLFAANYAAIANDPVSIGNSAAIVGGLGSNGNITMSNTASVCGTATPGVGKTLTLNNSASVCAGFPTTPAQVPFSLPPVDQKGAPTSNDNGRICAVGGDPCTGNVTWSAATRSLTLGQTATVTLTGDVYSFCNVTLRNTSRLLIAPRTKPLRIYMDTPESCGTASTAGSMSLSQNTDIVNLNTDPTTLELFVAGSPNRSTSVDFDNSSNAQTTMSIYAPQSLVSITNHVDLVGAVAAKKFQIGNNSSVTYDGRVTGIMTTDWAIIYQNGAWQECTTVASGLALDSGC